MTACGSFVAISRRRLPPQVAPPPRIFAAEQPISRACGSFVALLMQRLPPDMAPVDVE
jgi:hypothetical protein